MSLDHYQSLVETMHLLSTPATGKGLTRGAVNSAWDDYNYWQGQDKKTLKRINALIVAAARAQAAPGSWLIPTYLLFEVS